MITLSIIALLIGPLFYHLIEEKKGFQELIDGFVFISISGLIFLHLIAEAIPHAGAPIFLFLIAGLFGPTILERVMQRGARRVHLTTMILGTTGLCLHALLDGIALVETQLQNNGFLPLAIILHRIPVGLTLWWLLKPGFGKQTAFFVLILMCLATLAGYPGAESLRGWVHSDFSFFLQAFVSGTLLHVVLFQFHLGKSNIDHCCHQKDNTAHEKNIGNESTGNILGILFLILITLSTAHYDSEIAKTFFKTFFHLCLESAPALLIAYITGIFVYALLPQTSLHWLSSGKRATQAVKGAIVGIPLPICSCGVLPYYQMLIKKGTPPAAALAFLLATPELGLDAILLSFPLLGSELTLLRLIAAIFLAFFVAILISPTTSSKKITQNTEEAQQPLSKRLRQGAQYSLIELVDDTAPWIVIGLFIAALAHPLLDQYSLSGFGQLDVFLFAVIGTVMYVCASGSTPLVAVLIAGGVSPGAGLAFLLTGPATNISTFGVLSSLHGKRVAALFALCTVTLAILSGITVNFFFQNSITIPAFSEQHHHSTVQFLQAVCLVGVIVLFGYSLIRQGARKFISVLFQSHYP